MCRLEARQPGHPPGRTFGPSAGADSPGVTGLDAPSVRVDMPSRPSASSVDLWSTRGGARAKRGYLR